MFIIIYLKSGKTITIDIVPGIKVIKVKELIRMQVEIDPKRQILIYNGQKLDNEKTLEQCNVPPQSNLKLIEDMSESETTLQITINMIKGEKKLIIVTTDTTVKKLKEDINSKTGISTDDLQIMYKGIILSDNEATIKSLGIKQYENIFIVKSNDGGLH